jgi:hypothetical protein
MARGEVSFFGDSIEKGVEHNDPFQQIGRTREGSHANRPAPFRGCP